MPKPKAVLFDCDGLLLDTQRSWTGAVTDVAEEYGCSLSLEEQESLRGKSLPAIANDLAEWLSRPRCDEKRKLRHRLLIGKPGLRWLWKRRLRQQLYERLDARIRTDVTLLPGARELVSALRGSADLAVVTNAPRRIVHNALGVVGLVDEFDVIVAEEDARAKPAPEGYRKACKLLGVKPTDAVALEDSPRGVDAARLAGLSVIGVPAQGGPELHAGLVADSLLDEAIWHRLGITPPKPDARPAEGSPDLLQTLYVENVKVASVFWDWRHKVLTVLFTAFAALFFVATWTITNVDSPYSYFLAVLPVLFLLMMARASMKLEERNNEILDWTYSVGAVIERHWLPLTLTSGIFTSFRLGRRRYRGVLRTLFRLVFWGSAAAAGALFAIGVYNAVSGAG